MAESLFDIFGDHITRQTVKNVSRQPLSNIENMGKSVSSGPIKPNEPLKKSEGLKKSFLANNQLTGRTASRQPLSYIENITNSSTGPLKPNEPVKKSEAPKKSFLSNSGVTLKNTPVRNVFTPRAVNVGSMILGDEANDKGLCGEDVEFHKPSYKYDNHQRDMFDYLPVPEPEVMREFSPPSTPPPAISKHSMDFNCSYQDEFFKDDFSMDSLQDDDDLGLPDLY